MFNLYTSFSFQNKLLEVNIIKIHRIYEMISLYYYIIHLKKSFCSTHFSDLLLH